MHASRWIAAALAALLVVAAIAESGCKAASTSSATSPATTAQAQKYHCPMHPTYVSDKPGDCPICGMKLVPMAAVTPLAPGGAGAGGTGTSATVATAVTGRSVVILSPERRSLLGVRSEAVRQQRIEKSLRTVGRIAADERRLVHFHTKFEGFVEHLYVNFTGEYVKKGAPLLSIYSQELVATQQEYLLALRAQKMLGTSAIRSVAEGSTNLLDAARQRLLQWDIRAEDIAEVERTGIARRTFDLYATTSGYVIQKNVVQGFRVMPADTLFEIADLSRLWVMADVYDTDLAAVHLGTSAEVTLSSVPGRVWRGTVTNIAPTLDDKTRTIKVRVEVDNSDGVLKPDMYGDVWMRNDLGMGLVIPDSAVVDTGDRKLVFLDRPDGGLEPREIETGVRLPDGYQVIKGLAQGDRIVTAANFLLDSESSLKAALSAITQSSAAHAGEKR
jgi:Cu(I)/Ag(I) efflux system membrane fusion protein